MSFFAELKRRNVFKVGVAYVIVAWLLIQVTDTVAPALHLPEWTLTFIVYLLIIGFVLALFLAWAFELTPEGIKATTSEGPEQYHTHTTGQRLNYFIIGVLVLTVTFLVVDNYVLFDEPEIAPVVEQTVTLTPPTEEQETPAVATPTNEALPNSIAVLPFENMSPNPDDAYFASGLHEEILNQLAKLKNMNVIARTTMRQYANTDKSMAEIAAELKVKNVLEGSVRYANGKVRVTTQLIDGKEGVHLWSDTFERDFEDIFTVESEIAMNVANAMIVEFSLEEQEQMEKLPTTSAEAYALYLAARTNYNTATIVGSDEGLEKINKALELDPEFVQAWILKSQILNLRLSWVPDTDKVSEIANDAALRAWKLEPTSREAQTNLAATLIVAGDFMRAAAVLGIPDGNRGCGEELAICGVLGYSTQALASAYRRQEKDPLNILNAFWLIMLHDTLGDIDAALAENARGRELFNRWGIGEFNALVAVMGHGLEDMVMEQAEITATGYGMNNPDNPNPIYTKVIKNLASPEIALKELQLLYTEDFGTAGNSFVGVFAAHLGDPQLSLQALKVIFNATAINGAQFWRSLYREVRQLDEFRDFLRKKGFVEYWQKYGWPDLCKPIREDDFECD